MTQTQPNKGGPSIGAAAAQAAAAGATAPKPTDKPADAKATDKPAEGGGGGGSNGAAAGPAADKKKRESKSKVFVIVGTVQEFESVVQAEKFLNGPEAPAGEYVVLKGARTRTSKKVSLR